MHLAMTIRANQNAFFKFGLNLFPASSVSFTGNTKIFLPIDVVKLQRLDTSTITTEATLTTLFSNR